MKAFQKRTLAFLTCLILLLGLFTPAAASGVTPPADSQFTCINPHYAGVITEADLVQREQVGSRLEAGTEAEPYRSLEEAAAGMRKAMEARAAVIALPISLPQGGYQTGMPKDIFRMAVAHTGVPTQGDSLEYVWGGYQCSISSHGNTFTIEYTMTYYTTLQQEQQLDAEVAQLLGELNLWDRNDYDKVRGVYDWMCSHITYDYDNLGNDSYKLKYTAYAAMHNRTAVCQGYSALLYRLLLELDVDVRVITSTSHAWNIVRLGGIYYNVDSTWDVNSTGEYRYFLKNMENFPKHQREPDFASREFNKKYPMSPTDFDVNDVLLPFTDVGNRWYREPVKFVYVNGIMAGYTEKTFAPAKSITRAELMCILHRMSGSPNAEGAMPFHDVNPTTWYGTAVLWASQNGIAAGMTPDTFAPNTPVDRETMVTFFCRYAASEGVDTSGRADLTRFTDSDQLHSWTAESVAWAVSAGILSGMTDTTLCPLEISDRAQAASLIEGLSQHLS